MSDSGCQSLSSGNEQISLHIKLLNNSLGCLWGQCPIVKWRPPHLCSKKRKWWTELSEGFPFPPFSGSNFCGEGTGHFMSSWEQIWKWIWNEPNRVQRKSFLQLAIWASWRYRISSPISRAIFSVFDPKFWEIFHEERGSACSRGFYILKIYSCWITLPPGW